MLPTGYLLPSQKSKVAIKVSFNFITLSGLEYLYQVPGLLVMPNYLGYAFYFLTTTKRSKEE
jgi:hypothetical protein